jgi:hypothetical protein
LLRLFFCKKSYTFLELFITARSGANVYYESVSKDTRENQREGVIMLSNDEALREKIHSFMRRKEDKYPELAKETKHAQTYSGGFHKTVDPHPYILIGSR